ncbi:MAG: 4-alpha-glucanotransferase, partial [Planctomycetota bacterium]
NSKGRPTHVAGVPPDYFSKTGQLWGNPLYKWDAMEEAGYRWWLQRLQAAFEQFDLLRIDHFRGFEAYWSVPARNKTAVGGEWIQGPGTGPFDAAQKSLGPLEIVAEDLGLITEEVHQLREQLEFPGMRVLQFGFDNDHDEFHRPDAYPENSVAYTGTHDNSTIVSWYRDGTKNKKRCELLEPWLEKQDQELRLHQQWLSMVYQSDSKLAIAPVQDVLGLDDGSRMNLPGTAEGNWRWRLAKHDFDHEIVEQLAKMTRDSKRHR